MAKHATTNDIPPASLPFTGYSRAAQLLPFLPFKKTTLYKLSQSGAFPAPVRLGERMTAWSNESVHKWFKEQGMTATPAANDA